MTILLIHGLGASKVYMQNIVNYPSLSEYSILIPDLVGFGDTAAPTFFGYTMREQAEALKLLMNGLGIIGDLVLIPHSMGGPIGIMLAEMLDSRVRGIVYAEGNIDLGDCFGSNRIITRYTFEEYKATGFRRDLDALRRNPANAGISYLQEKAGPVSMYMSSTDLVKVSREGTLANRLVNLKVPVVAVFGEKNKGLWTSEKKLGALFPLVFIAGAGHGMMLDNPDAFYGAVTEFINSLRLD